jgi:hypothetical protein
VIQREMPAEAALAEVEAALGKLPTDVEKEIHTWLQTQTTDFVKQVQDHLAQATAHQQELRALLDDLKTAAVALDEGNAAEALQLLDATRLRFVRILAAEQKDSIDPARPPLGVSPAKWQTTATRLRGLLDDAIRRNDPEQAARLFGEAYATHVDERASGLETHVKNWHAQIEAHTNLSDADKARHKQAVAAPLLNLSTVRSHSAAGRLREAAAALNEIETAVKKAVKDIPPRGMQQGGAAAAVPAASLMEQPMAPSVPHAMPKSFDQDPLRSRTSAKTALTWGERLFLAGGALIAVLLGLKVLYMDNATWGGATDWLAAFLWGLGITQTSGAAYEGFSGLMAKVGK